MKTAQIGDRVVYSKSFLRNIGAGATDDLWHKVGPVVGLGSNARTWHCAVCKDELGIMAPINGREVFTPPPVSPCCNALVFAKDHGCGSYSMAHIVRVKWDGETFETAVSVANIARKGSFQANEETRA